MLLSHSDNRGRPPSTTVSDWPARALLAAVALGGTLAYAASFRAVPRGGPLVEAGAAVGLAAALSWPAFGAALLLVTAARPSMLEWVDACLRTMCAGVVFLAAAAVLNLNAPLLGAGVNAFPWLAAAHVALLFGANGVMLATFVNEARRLGLAAATAITLWMLALNGSFFTTLMILYRIGVVKP
jgi:hypothetical protein